MDLQSAPSLQFHPRAIALAQILARGAKRPRSESVSRDGNRRRCARPDPVPDALWTVRLPLESDEPRASDTAPPPTVHARPIGRTNPHWTRSRIVSAFLEDLEQKFRDPYDTSEYMEAALPVRPAAMSDNPRSMVQTGQDGHPGIACWRDSSPTFSVPEKKR
jgi:hypothetical protein